MCRSTHHFSIWCEPLSTLDHAEGAITQFLKEGQVFLTDKTGECLLLSIHWRRCGGEFSERTGRLGTEVSFWSLATEHLRDKQQQSQHLEVTSKSPKHKPCFNCVQPELHQMCTRNLRTDSLYPITVIICANREHLKRRTALEITIKERWRDRESEKERGRESVGDSTKNCSF